MSLPTPTFHTAAESIASFDETECDPVIRPGVDMFANFVKFHQGGVKGRIIQKPCAPYRSGHNAGRAWDWAIRALPGEREPADELIDWLLANDAELARRAGIVYLIWDKQIWSPAKGWRPYDGYDDLGNCISPPCRNAHVDHVHFSFSRAGSEGQTSFYDWLRGDSLARPRAVSPAYFLFGVTGFLVGFAGAELYRSRTRKRRRR